MAEYFTHGLCKLLSALDAHRLPGAVHAGELLVEHLALEALLVVLDVPHVVPVGHLDPHDVPGAAIFVLGNHLDLVGRDPSGEGVQFLSFVIITWTKNTETRSRLNPRDTD